MRTLVFVCFFGSSLLTMADPIEEELSRARDEYKTAIEKARAALVEAFDQRIKEAADSGNLAEVKNLQAEKETFDNSGKLPRSTKVAKAVLSCQEAAKKAKAAMTQAYAKAIKDYTKTLDIASADGVKAEADKFRTQSAFEKPSETPAEPSGAAVRDNRTVWLAKSGSRFEWIEGKKWKEVTFSGLTREYLEIARNADFIELQRADKLRIRIHSSVFYWDGFQKNGAYTWKENPSEDESRGGWKMP